MRLRTAAAATATTVISAGAAAVVAGRYASDVALKPSRGGPLPGDPPLTVHAVDTEAGRLTLSRTLASLRPGTYGLTGDATHAVIGAVVEDVPHAADTVVRHLEWVSHGRLQAGGRMRLTPQVHIGTPLDALGLHHSDVDIPGALGTFPAWYVPGGRSTWVITIHGLGTTREHPMVIMPFLHEHRFPVLDITYRGDAGAPPSTDGIGNLGAAEWRDVDAAIRYALRNGAARVILYGWSTGASMALRAAANSALRDRIEGLVLDSPVLDWQTTLRALARGRGVPAPLLPLAVRAVQGRTGLREYPDAGYPEFADPERLAVPTLIAHGPQDALAPWDRSRELAALRADLVDLFIVPDAPHAAMWNADPARYEETLRRFLTPLM